MSRSILVTGATGKQGGALIEHLISKSNDFTILAVTRDAKSPSANRLSSKSPSIKLVQGDLEYPIELFKAAKEVSPNQKIWGVFSVQAVNFKGGKIEDAPEVKQGISLVDESLKNNVEQFVYSSVDRGGSEKSWNNPTNVPHFATKNMIEQHLKKSTIGSSMKWSILRPVIFMDNLEPGFQTFIYPEKYNGKALSIAGDSFTFNEMEEKFKIATGKSTGATYGFLGSALKFAIKELGIMLNWFRDQGLQADITELKKIHPDMMDLETWLKTKSNFVKR